MQYHTYNGVSAQTDSFMIFLCTTESIYLCAISPFIQYLCNSVSHGVVFPFESRNCMVSGAGCTVVIACVDPVSCKINK